MTLLVILLARGCDAGLGSALSISRCSTAVSGEVRQGCERLIARAQELDRLALERGGWLCRFAMLLTRKPPRKAPGTFHDAIEAACGSASAQPPTSVSMVVSIQHNGLGNQLFELAAGMLLASSLGADFRARKIRDFEGPHEANKLPPNSDVSWRALRQIWNGFDNRTVFLDAIEAPGCADRMSPLQREYEVNGTLILAQRPADMRRLPLAVALSRLLSGEPTCVKMVGYFQAYGLFRGSVAARLRDHLLSVPDKVRLSEEPAADDVVCHVRLCDGPVHSYQYFDYETYFRRVFESARGPVKVVTRCSPARKGVVQDLVRFENAEVVRPKLLDGDGEESAADFVYLSRATRLVITESTFSWWAAFLNRRAEAVHAPARGVVPVAYDRAHFVFHDPHRGKYFGRYNHSRRDFDYAR